MNKLFCLGFCCFLLFSGCSTKETTNPALSQFTSWVSKNKYDFNEYFVVELKGCNYCSSQVIRIVQEGYLDINDTKAVVLIVNERSELYPVKEFVNKNNLLVFDGRKIMYPIIESLPRMYKKEKDGSFSYTVLKMADFKKQIDIINRDLGNRGNYWVGSIKHPITGIAVPGNEGFMVLHKEGSSHQDIMIFDAETGD